MADAAHEPAAVDRMSPETAAPAPEEESGATPGLAAAVWGESVQSEAEAVVLEAMAVSSQALLACSEAGEPPENAAPDGQGDPEDTPPAQPIAPEIPAPASD